MLHNFAISAPAEIKGKLAGSHTESVPARPLFIKIPTLRGERSVRVRVGHKPTSVFKHYPPPTYRRTTHKGGIPAIRPKQMNILRLMRVFASVYKNKRTCWLISKGYRRSPKELTETLTRRKENKNPESRRGDRPGKGAHGFKRSSYNI